MKYSKLKTQNVPFNICLLLLLVLLAGCGASATTPPVPADLAANVAPASQLLDPSSAADVPEVGQPAPNFAYTMANGTTTKLSDLRGKKVIVNFWATWCEPCRAEMPDLQKIQQSSAGHVAVIGVNLREQLDKIGPFGKEMGVTFPLVANPTGELAAHYGVRTGVPVSVFINTDGTVGVWNAGVMTYDTITQQLDRLK